MWQMPLQVMSLSLLLMMVVLNLVPLVLLLSLVCIKFLLLSLSFYCIYLFVICVDPLVFPLKGIAQTEASAQLISQMESILHTIYFNHFWILGYFIFDIYKDIHRSISQLQQGLFNVESMERQLYKQLETVSTTPLPPLLRPRIFLTSIFFSFFSYPFLSFPFL